MSATYIVRQIHRLSGSGDRAEAAATGRSFMRKIRIGSGGIISFYLEFLICGILLLEKDAQLINCNINCKECQ